MLENTVRENNFCLTETVLITQEYILCTTEYRQSKQLLLFNWVLIMQRFFLFIYIYTFFTEKCNEYLHPIVCATVSTDFSFQSNLRTEMNYTTKKNLTLTGDIPTFTDRAISFLIFKIQGKCSLYFSLAFSLYFPSSTLR